MQTAEFSRLCTDGNCFLYARYSEAGADATYCTGWAGVETHILGLWLQGDEGVGGGEGDGSHWLNHCWRNCVVQHEHMECTSTAPYVAAQNTSYTQRMPRCQTVPYAVTSSLVSSCHVRCWHPACRPAEGCMRCRRQAELAWLDAACNTHDANRKLTECTCRRSCCRSRRRSARGSTGCRGASCCRRCSCRSTGRAAIVIVITTGVVAEPIGRLIAGFVAVLVVIIAVALQGTRCAGTAGNKE